VIVNGKDSMQWPVIPTLYPAAPLQPLLFLFPSFL
jgi:hypothetical protein